LGRETLERFAGLPYLLKVLAAAKPLSIQVHPNPAQARAGYQREQRASIPLGAPERCYRDPNHKSELLVALSPFDALCGFRPHEEIIQALDEHPELRELLPREEPTPSGLARLLEHYFALPSNRVEPALRRLIERLEAMASTDPESPEYWALRAHHELSPDCTPDRGLLFVFIMALVHLDPGQGMFLPAGCPHAYLHGAGVELMTNSDNVLRAGLTTKYIDPQELLRIVRFDAGPPTVLEAIADEEGTEGLYPTPAAELSLSRLQLAAGQPVDRTARGPETILILPSAEEIETEIGWDEGARREAGARAYLVPDGMSYRITANGPVTAFRATLPDVTPAELFRGGRPTRLAFGTSGLRGLVTDITDLEAYINTRGFLDYLVAIGDAIPGTPVALAGDLRPSTDSPERSIARSRRASHPRWRVPVTLLRQDSNACIDLLRPAARVAQCDGHRQPYSLRPQRNQIQQE
jgi:mannose-6-phosphate isomerase class I